MAHWSEEAVPLRPASIRVVDPAALAGLGSDPPQVYLLWFPPHRSDADAAASAAAVAELAAFCGTLAENSTVCVLTTPPDAAWLLPVFEQVLKFQLWIAVKTRPDAGPGAPGQLPHGHAALLVFTRYRGSLRHTKTRIAYTYCPACGKTTKDYGGKKHVYHEYGTLMADVWRDLPGGPAADAQALAERLGDLFGLEPYTELRVLDLRAWNELSAGRTVQASPTSPASEGAVPCAAPEGLRNADCLEALRQLPENSVDFCFADPPYNVEKSYDRWDDSLESAAYFAWCDAWLTALHRVLKPGRTLAVLNIPHWAARHYQHLCRFMEFQAWIAWEALSVPVRRIMPAHYSILCFSKGSPRPLPGLAAPRHGTTDDGDLRPLAEGYCLRPACLARRERRGGGDRAPLTDLWWDLHRLKHNSRRADHPCQLPPPLMRRLFALFTQEGEMVLDPFNGAGTSTLVAEQMGRRYVGIELSGQYHQLATQRHTILRQGGDPFAKRDAVPGAKNSRVPRLAKQRYEVAKKELQLDVRRIARQLGRLPTREEVAALSRHPLAFFEAYFVSWGEVCAAARTTGMSELPPERDSSLQLRFPD